MDEKPTIKKRNVKYPRIELKTGKLVLVLPKNEKISPEELIKRHRKWIEKKKSLINEIKEKYIIKNLVQRDEKSFYNLVESFVKEAKEKLRLEPKKIQIRLMKTKWGSCTKRSIIILNILAKFLPSRLIKYIIFHEMYHLWFPKHNKSFWLAIGKEFPNYLECEQALLGYWFLINQKLNHKRRKKNV